MEACICPLPAALAEVPNQACPEDLGQIQKAILRRASAAALVTADDDPKVLATWTPLFAAADGTKAVITPSFESATITAPEAITEGGGDNTTLNGVELVVGEGFSQFNAMFRSIQYTVIKALRGLRCEVLEVWFVNEFGQIIGQTDDAGVSYHGIPLYAYYVSTSGNEGFATNDKSTLRFAIDADWRNTIAILKPTDFNALTQLVNS